MSTDSSRRSVAPVLAALAAAELVGAFESNMIVAALKTLIETFGRPAAVGWLVSGYLIVAAAAGAIGGRLGDLYGRRRVLLWVLVISAAGSLISACAPNLTIMILGRGVQGVSGAILPLCFGLVRERLPPEKTALGVALLSATATAGSGVAFLLSGLLVDLGGWRWIFFASAICGAAALLCVLLCLPAKRMPRTGGRLDLLGGVLFAPGLLGLLLALTNGSRWGWTSPGVLASAAGGAALLSLWVVHSLRQSEPLIDVRLFANRNIAVATLCAALGALGSFQISQFLLLMVQQPVWTGIGLGLTATLAGLLKLPSSASSTLGSAVSGRICATLGPRFAIIAGMFVAAACWFSLTQAHGSISALVVVSIACSFGTSMLLVAAPTIVVAEAPAHRTSEATGLLQVVRMAFQGVGAQVMLLLLATSTVRAPMGAGEYPGPDAYRLTMLVMGGLCLVTAAAALALPRRGRAPSVSTEAARAPVRPHTITRISEET